MVKQIFVNLPVKNLEASIEFFTKLGFTFNAQFSDDTSTCMVMSDTIYAMLLSHEKFQSFSPNPISDASKQTEVLNALSLESREAVSEMVSKAVSAGGKTYNEAKDHGFMIQHGFQDLDGHIWEVFYMDPSFVQPS
jgi:uncharacterized protein